MKTGLLARRTFLAGAAIAPLVSARAQTSLPDKQVQLLVGFVTGGGIDFIARKIAVPIERRIGRHVTVINRPGGPGAAPGEMLKKDAGEGTVLAFMPSTTLVSSLVPPGFGFDPLTDLTPITIAGTWPIVVLACMAVFLLLQFLPALVAPQAERVSKGEQENPGKP